MPRPLRLAMIAIAAAALSACATTYTGPVEVTRFVSEKSASLGQGTISIYFPDDLENLAARDAFADAIAAELQAQGYQLIVGRPGATYTAVVRTSRNPLSTGGDGRGPVSVGVGGGTGSYGSGVGVGVGINLGGGDSGPRVMSEVSVRIVGPDEESLWEGRAQQPVSIRSPYADVDASARTLAAALFKDFPGGNGETVTIDVDDL